MKRMKTLKKCVALFLATAILVCSNATYAYAAEEKTKEWTSYGSYAPEDMIAYIGLYVDVGGIATHSEKFLNSVYSFAGVISTSESANDYDSDKDIHYEWGTLSGVLSVSASTVGGVSGSVGVSGDNGEGNVSSSVESKSTSLSFSCAKNSEKTISTSLSAIGFLSCELMISHYTRCYDTDTNRMVDSHSRNHTWDLHEDLDY